MFVVEFAIPNDIPLIMFNGWYKPSTYRRMFMIISECCLFCFAVGVMMWKIDDIFVQRVETCWKKNNEHSLHISSWSPVFYIASCVINHTISQEDRGPSVGYLISLGRYYIATNLSWQVSDLFKKIIRFFAYLIETPQGGTPRNMYVFADQNHAFR